MHILTDAIADAQDLYPWDFGFNTLQCAHVLRLACIEVRSEATEDIAIFFKLLNEMLQIVGKKDKDYKFNPQYILCDEAGGNIRGIKEALGLQFAAT